MNTSRTLPEKATRNHIGYNKHYDRMKEQSKDITAEFRSLVVKGTLDRINPVFLVEHTQRQHPIDKDYFKSVLVLHPDRKRRLEVLRQKYQGRNNDIQSDISNQRR